ncbi:MAG: hypothetical protein FWE28_02105 [Oscillospiraceae bacterium]|nr:hypothetical protein [Oscillospiraceae bacterium]
MKKFLCAILIVIISLTVACGYEKRALPMPEFPLDETAIVAALREVELPWTIEGVVDWSDGSPLIYALYKDGSLIASLTSGVKDGERIVAISFTISHNDMPSLAEEYWENAIVLATLLYGGLESAHQIYHYFRNEFGTENTVRHSIDVLTRDPLARDEAAIWERVVEGAYCVIMVERVVNTEREYLGAIQLTSDLATFGLSGGGEN